MATLWRRLVGIVRDESGFTALEYTLITVIIGTVVIAGVELIGNSLNTSYTSISSVLQQHAQGM